ncbi:hypothetical protein BGZ72_006349 [Mortierella alpina]|nr:hypothetical protein BGZ72_006349 [Mortierella alpina]
MSALLCLAATAAAASIPSPAHDSAAVNPWERRDQIAAALQSNGDISYAGPKQKRHGHNDDDDDEDDEDDEEDKKKSAGKAPPGKAPAGKGPAGKDGAKTVPGKGTAPSTKPSTNAGNALAHDTSSPLWLVQPFGQSVWEQGRIYEIRWGPNPNGEYAKALKPNSPVDISLMQGAPGDLKEVKRIKVAANEATHKFTWTVPADVPVGTNYAIRINRGPVDTYSHYFEIVKAGDARSSKSNVGDPEELPQKGDAPMPLNKGPGPKPAGPPNPPPAEAKPNPPATKPTIPDTASKPIIHSSAAVSEVKGANMLAFAMALFSAVYFL